MPHSPSDLNLRLQDITETLASANTEQAVFDVILHPAIQALDASAATMLLGRGGGRNLHVEATVGYADGQASIWQDALTDDDGPAADALTRRTPLFFEHDRELVRAYPNVEARTGATAPVVATAVLPMFLDERPLGVLVLDFQEPYVFTDDERRFLRILAAQCAIAFGRARLLRDLEGRVSERTQQLANQNEVLETQRAELTLHSDALRQVNEELDAFAVSISHDLRTPVRHIGGFLALLRREVDGQLSEKAERYFQVIAEATARMNKLIDALLDLSRTSSQTVRVQAVDLRGLVAGVQAELLPETAERQVTWNVGPLPVVMADAELLRQVLMNLLSNALKYTRTREEAVIEIQVEDRPSEWRVTVQDNGVGFNAKYQERLFGVFQRLHREDEFEGMGVGLANVRRIILRHGGQVWAQSEHGEGATFGFTLPRLQSPE